MADPGFPHPFQDSDTAAPFATLSHEVSDYVLWCAITSAFEGGSNYWLKSADPEGTTTAKAVFLQDVPFLGGRLRLTTRHPDDEIPRKLTAKSLRDGLRVMQKKAPGHLADMLSGGGDAITGDVYLQCCVFGDVIYG